MTNAGIPFAVNSDTKFYDREKNIWIENLQPVFACIYGKKAQTEENNNSTSNTAEITINKKIHVGFNAKGNLDTSKQYTYVKKEFSALKKKKADTSKIYLRLQGGTISQKSYSKNWSGSQIAQWAKLQNSYKCKYIFVVNFNDTASNQLKFYQRFLKAGIRFSMIELGNEQYLPKFSQSKRIKLPFYVQFAPKSENNQTYYSKWNTSIIKAINDRKFASDKINGTIHLYERNGAGSLDARQIAALRERIKRNIHIAVTESGVVDKKNMLSEDRYAAQELDLTKRILAQMQSGDTFLNQVLYTDYKTVGSAILHPQTKGLTVKGEKLVNFLQQYWIR